MSASPFPDTREFTHIPDEIRQHLETLTRECAVYADFWIDEIEDFRHVRIDFTPKEREDFIRRSWSFELFLRAGRPTLAAKTPGIDPQVANDADTYGMRTVDGTTIGPPYHCFAGFLGEDLEELLCTKTDRVTVIDLKGKERLLFEVLRAIESSLTTTIRSFNHREKGLARWDICCEDDVRDLLYVMLRPLVFDLVTEEVVPSKAGIHRVADLCSKAVPFLIEIKWISNKHTWKKKIDELYVDIQSYVEHPSSYNLILVIVDSVSAVLDPRQVEAALTDTQSIGEREMNIRAIVCDT